MELGPQGEVVQARAEVLVEEEVVEAEWEVLAPGLVPVGSVSVLLVVRKCPIRQEYPAIT
jgi:hypothetical protein